MKIKLLATAFVLAFTLSAFASSNCNAGKEGCKKTKGQCTEQVDSCKKQQCTDCNGNCNQPCNKTKCQKQTKCKKTNSCPNDSVKSKAKK